MLIKNFGLDICHFNVVALPGGRHRGQQMLWPTCQGKFWTLCVAKYHCAHFAAFLRFCLRERKRDVVCSICPGVGVATEPTPAPPPSHARTSSSSSSSSSDAAEMRINFKGITALLFIQRHRRYPQSQSYHLLLLLRKFLRRITCCPHVWKGHNSTILTFCHLISNLHQIWRKYSNISDNKKRQIASLRHIWPQRGLLINLDIYLLPRHWRLGVSEKVKIAKLWHLYTYEQQIIRHKICGGGGFGRIKKEARWRLHVLIFPIHSRLLFSYSTRRVPSRVLFVPFLRMFRNVGKCDQVKY